MSNLRKTIATTLMATEFNASDLDGKVSMLLKSVEEWRAREKAIHEVPVNSVTPAVPARLANDPDAQAYSLSPEGVDVRHGSPAALVCTTEIEDTAFTIRLASLADLARVYTTHVETAPTHQVCRCFWREHGDDPTKKVLVDVHPDCWQHSKEARIIGFFEWLVCSDANRINIIPGTGRTVIGVINDVSWDDHYRSFPDHDDA